METEKFFGKRFYNLPRIICATFENGFEHESGLCGQNGQLISHHLISHPFRPVITFSSCI
jgi:hypothetical protein